MKIEAIDIRNFMMLSDVSIDLSNHNVCLIAGRNEQGKSSILEAIRLAMTGEGTRVKLKKDMGALVREGAKSGSVAIRLSNGLQAKIDLPSAKFIASLGDHPILPFVLDIGKFSAISDNERRAFLFELAGVKHDTQNVLDRMSRRGCNPKKAKEISPILRSGFHAAESEAKAKARDAKASWKTVTGGETWGKEKGENFSLPVQHDADIDQAKDTVSKSVSELAEIEQLLSAAQQDLGAKKGEIVRRQQAESEISDLQVKAKSSDRIKKKLALDEAELESWRGKVEETRAKAKGIKQGDPLLHKLATATDYFLGLIAESTGVAGLLNGDLAKWDEFDFIEDAEAALEEYQSKHGSPVGKSDQGHEEALLKLPEYEGALSLLENAVKNGKRDLEAAEKAKSRLSDIKKDQSDPIDISAAQALVESLTEKRNKLIRDTNEHQQRLFEANQAQKTVERAAHLHAEIVEWIAIAEALAPDGIPGELLNDAIKPFNDRLRETCSKTGWDQVSITADMQIMVGNRPFGLMSESAQFRANAALAEAISFLSGISFFAIDRIDVLDIQNRLIFLKWINAIAKDSQLHTAIVFGTFKSLPSVPTTILPVWIEHGEILAAEERKAS